MVAQPYMSGDVWDEKVRRYMIAHPCTVLCADRGGREIVVARGKVPVQVRLRREDCTMTAHLTPIMSTLTWVTRTHTLDAEDPATRALEDNPGWRLIGVGVGAGGQSTLTFGWPWPEPQLGPGTYYDGCRAALRWHAVHRDGQELVGMGRRTLKEALAEVDEAERTQSSYGAF